MELIDKVALVEEIKKEIKCIYASREYVGIPSWEERIIQGLNKTIEIINTLEVKEVDCDKEIGMYTTKELLWKRNKATNVFHLTQGDIDRISKHFFEFGLKAQKGE